MINKNKKHFFLTKLIAMLSYLLAIIIILNCNSVYITSSNFDFIKKILTPLMLIIAITYIFCCINLNNLKVDNSLIIGIVIALYLGIFFILNNKDNSIFSGGGIIVNFVIFFLLVWVEKDSRFPKILRAYVNIMSIVAGISIFFWIFGSYTHTISPKGSIDISWGNYRIIPNYYNVYFETQYLDTIIRNSAIFVEAPIAALNFLLALSISILFRDKIDIQHTNIKNVILIIAGCLTMSTAIYIGIIILFIFKLIQNNNSSKWLSFIKYTFIVVILPIAFYLISSLFSSKLDTQSGINRMSDYHNAFAVWENYPLMGAGINAGVNEGINLVNGFPIGHYGFSSSFTKVLGDGGLYLILLIVLALIIAIRKSILTRNNARLCFIVILIYLFMVTIFAQNYLMYYLFDFIALWNSSFIKKSMQSF